MERRRPQEGDKFHIGIDLGTTFCSCAYFDLTTREPKMFTIDGFSDMASWINMFGLNTKNKSCWIGNGAKDSEFPEFALYDNKRIIGREPQEVKIEDKESWPFKVNRKGNSLVMVTDNPENGEKIELLPEQVAALLLKKYLQLQKNSKKNIGSVVIAVPAQFNDRQRDATFKAAKIAGIEVKSLINEPVAALLAYKSSFPDDFANVTYSVVFDFGGGTLDVAVCKNEGDRIDVVKCGGDQNLGGNDFDLVLMNVIKERILEEYSEGAKYFEKQRNETGKDKHIRKQVLGRVKKAAEKVKIELSKKNIAHIPLDDIFKGILNKKDIKNIGEITILREEDFEEGCKELFEKCENCLKNTIRESGLSRRDIDKIVLVGGSSKIPKVRQIITDYFNNKKIICNNQFDPLTAVAKGAAIYAGDLSRGGMNATKIINYVPHSIGVEIAQGRFLKIINKDAIVPAKGYQILTLEPGVKQTTIRIYQGESKYADAPGMKFVKSFILKNNSQSTSTKSVEITFKFNENGMVEATAKVLNDENSEVSISVEMKNLEHDEDIKKCQQEIHKIMPDDF